MTEEKAIAEALVMLAKWVRSGQVQAFDYKWGKGKPLDANYTLIPDQPAKYVKMTFSIPTGPQEFKERVDLPVEKLEPCKHEKWAWKTGMVRYCLLCNADLEPEEEMVKKHRPYADCGNPKCEQCRLEGEE